MTDSQPPEYCSCENVAQGELGLIEPDELVARVVCNPRHIYKKDGSIKPGVFPPSHIAKTGLSLMRPEHLNEDELKMQADAIASHSIKDTAIGVIESVIPANFSFSQTMPFSMKKLIFNDFFCRTGIKIPAKPDKKSTKKIFKKPRKPLNNLMKKN
ncbi:MAG: hypothetical protein OXC66_12520 [Roseovarius sp.]|nr:hypothetical protein [Roseovarius sp.]